MNWIIANASEIIAIITAIVTVASMIANLTPTETDNKIIAAITRVINLLGLNIKKNL